MFYLWKNASKLHTLVLAFISGIILFWMLAIYVDTATISDSEENVAEESNASEFLQLSVPDHREKNSPEASFATSQNKTENSEGFDDKFDKIYISSLNNTSQQTDPENPDMQESQNDTEKLSRENETVLDNDFLSSKLMNSSSSQFTNKSSSLEKEIMESENSENNKLPEFKYSGLYEPAEKNETQGLNYFNDSSHFYFTNHSEIEGNGSSEEGRLRNKADRDEVDDNKEYNNSASISNSTEKTGLDDESSFNSSSPLEIDIEDELLEYTNETDSDKRIQLNASINENFNDGVLQKEELNEEHIEIVSEQLSADVKIKSSDNKCIPSMFGLTNKQASTIFRFNKRKFSCGDKYDIFTFKNNTITMDCVFPEKAEFSLGSPPDQETIGSASTSLSWKVYTSPTDTANSEYGFAKCGESKKQAFLHNKFSESASKRAQERRKTIENSLNLTSSKPLTVLTVVFDSVSRQHFYRILPKTVEFMNQNIVKGKFSKQFAIYDFKIEHASGENTLPNVVPLLLGDSHASHKEKVKGSFLSNSEKSKSIQKEQAIWKYFEDQGFVTMFGWETRWDYLSKMVGRKILTDHVVSRLYFVASNLFGFKEDGDKERCIGNHYLHQHLLNYTKEFTRNYKDHNKFAYIHFSSGHERTGSVIRTMDTDLANYINDILEYYSQNEEDLVLILTSDHGLHVGPWDTYEGGKIENLLPYSFYILNKELISKLGKNTHEILTHNTEHITSKFDMYVTLKHLAHSPYEKISNDSPLYSNFKNKPLLKKAVSVFIEKIPDSRTCGDIGNPLYWCACLKFEEKNVTDYKELADNIGSVAAVQINERVARDKMQYTCATLELDNVIGMKHNPIAGISDLYSGVYKINVTIKNHPTFIFSIQAIVATEWEFGKYSRDSFEGEVFRMSNLIFKGQPLRVQVQSIVRADDNHDYCIELGNGYINGKISYCVCKSPKDYEIAPSAGNSEKKLYENAMKLIYTTIGKPGTSCDEACKIKNRDCQEWGLEIVNHFELLSQKWNGVNTYSIETDDGFKDFKRLQIAGVDRGEMPGLRSVNKELRFVQGNWTDLYCDTKISDIKPICSCSRHQVEI